jgi:hypothetical protein
VGSHNQRRRLSAGHCCWNVAHFGKCDWVKSLANNRQWDWASVGYGSVRGLVVAVRVSVCSTVISGGIWGWTRVWYVKARCGFRIPLPKHAGRCLLWHPKISIWTLDGGLAVKVVHRLSRGVRHWSAARRWTTCVWIGLSKTNSVSRRREISTSSIKFFPSRSSINLRSSLSVLFTCISNAELIII